MPSAPWRPLRQHGHSFFHNLQLFATGLRRYPCYNKATRELIDWILKNSWREAPAAPRKTADFHLRRPAQGASFAGTHVMLNAYFDSPENPAARRPSSVRLVTFESRRGAKVLERFGFRAIAEREINKIPRASTLRRSILTTAIKQLGLSLSGRTAAF